MASAIPSDTTQTLWPRVIGQRRVKRMILSAMRAGRLPHAYLFSGGEGVGKDALALELARILHCEKGGDEACDQCPSCARAASLQHPDIMLVIPLPRGAGETKDDGPIDKLSQGEIATIQEELAAKAADPYHRIAIPKATIIKINSIREIRRESAMAPSDGKRRVFIIANADLMGDEAANTLLKTLEEPPPHCMLILTTAHRDALLPTIRSRCQEIRFDPLTDEEIREALLKHPGVSAEQAALVARLANGSASRAVALLAEDLDDERRQVLAFVRHALAADPVTTCADVDRIADLRDRERAEMFLLMLLTWFRDALVLMHGGTTINVDQQKELGNFVAKFRAADLSTMIADVERALSLLDKNVYIKLILLQLVTRIRYNVMGRPE